MGDRAPFWERKKIRVSYEKRGGKRAESSLRHHTERTHGIVLIQTRGVDVGRGEPEIYMVYFPQVLHSAA